VDCPAKRIQFQGRDLGALGAHPVRDRLELLWEMVLAVPAHGPRYDRRTGFL